jgi:hypothetical protein
MGEIFRPYEKIVKLRKALAPSSRLFVGFGDQEGGKDCFLRVLRMAALIADGIDWKNNLNFSQDFVFG